MPQPSDIPPDPREPTMNTAQVAAWLNIHQTTVWRLVRQGRLRAYRVGRAFRFLESEVKEDLRPGTTNPQGTDDAPT